MYFETVRKVFVKNHDTRLCLMDLSDGIIHEMEFFI